MTNSSSTADDLYCARCGHAKTWHTDEIIVKGYGEGGRCGWWRDPMFSATEECSCDGFTADRGTIRSG